MAAGANWCDILYHRKQRRLINSCKIVYVCMFVCVNSFVRSESVQKSLAASIQIKLQINIRKRVFGCFVAYKLELCDCCFVQQAKLDKIKAISATKNQLYFCSAIKIAHFSIYIRLYWMDWPVFGESANIFHTIQ